MLKSNGFVLVLDFVFVFLLCCRGLHDKLQKPTFPTQLAVFDSWSQSNNDVYTIKCESQVNNHISFFINLGGCKNKSFNIRKDNSCLAYLLSLLISASGDVQVKGIGLQRISLISEESGWRN